MTKNAWAEREGGVERTSCGCLLTCQCIEEGSYLRPLLSNAFRSSMDGENPLTLVRALVSGASSPVPEGDISALLDERRKMRKQLDLLYRSIIHSLGGSDARLMADELKHLQTENRRLKQEHALLQRGSKDYSTLRRDDLCLLLARAEADLDKAVDQLTAANKDKKQLQAQKDSLVEQLKSLHGTVEERDKQMNTYLTKFNEEFQQRVQQGEEKVRQLGQENKALEKERWDLMKKAKKLSEDKVWGVWSASPSNAEHMYTQLHNEPTHSLEGIYCRSNQYILY